MTTPLIQTILVNHNITSFQQLLSELSNIMLQPSDAIKSVLQGIGFDQERGATISVHVLEDQYVGVFTPINDGEDLRITFPLFQIGYDETASVYF